MGENMKWCRFVIPFKGIAKEFTKILRVGSQKSSIAEAAGEYRVENSYRLRPEKRTVVCVTTAWAIICYDRVY